MTSISTTDLPTGVECEFIWPADGGDDLIDGWSGHLSDEEILRRSSFKSDRRKRTFTMGRVTARRLIARKLAIEPVDVGLVVAPDGAVDVDGFDGRLSITHTDVSAAAVISDGPVGIDMEPIQARIANLYKFVLHESEYGILDRSGLDRNSTTLVAWVVKEAVLKGMRTGLRRSPQDLALEMDFGTGIGSVAVTDGPAWACRYYRIRDCYVAIAVPA